jgi:hypothetical protein
MTKRRHKVKVIITDAVRDRLKGMDLAPPLSKGRLEGAIWIVRKTAWTKVGENVFEMALGYIVDLNTGTCTCQDFGSVNGGRTIHVCKHILAMVMVEVAGDKEV